MKDTDTMSMNKEAAVNTTNTKANSAAGEYLTFVLGAEEYGLEILKVQ